MSNHLIKPEIILWEKIRNGDIKSLGMLYDMYIDALFSYGLKIAKDKNLVMDCIHDLFLDVFKYKSKLASTDNVKYYLFKSLKHKINKEFSRKIITSAHEAEFYTSNAFGKFSKPLEDFQIIHEQTSEIKLKLKEALSLLTNNQRKVLFLRFKEDCTYEEISEIMNVSVETSRTTIYRGIKVLRKSFL